MYVSNIALVYYLATPDGCMGLNVLSSLSSFLTANFGCTSSGFLVVIDFTVVVVVAAVFSAELESLASSVCLHNPRIFKTSPAFKTMSSTSFDTVVSPENKHVVKIAENKY
jgi:hypothetical protein